MIKKTILLFLLFFMIVSCGKKGDPKYKDPENKVQIFNNKLKVTV
tara:strand:+ start:1139 stop:1273 length:135 start_codon:yes stop_codon:yes gene_type:complete